MEKLADELAATGKYKEIYLNRSWDTAIHTSKGTRGNVSENRPDLILIDHNGKICCVEVTSKSDDVKVLFNRNNINSSSGYAIVKYGEYDSKGNILNYSNSL